MSIQIFHVEVEFHSPYVNFRSLFILSSSTSSRPKESHGTIKSNLHLYSNKRLFSYENFQLIIVRFVYKLHIFETPLIPKMTGIKIVEKSQKLQSSWIYILWHSIHCTYRLVGWWLTSLEKYKHRWMVLLSSLLWYQVSLPDRWDYGSKPFRNRIHIKSCLSFI